MRLERELAEVKTVRDPLKNLRPASRKSHGEVPHGEATISVSATANVPVARRVGDPAWRDWELSRRARQEPRLEAEIRAPHRRTKKTCGPECLKKDLLNRSLESPCIVFAEYA
jgi:hypothetical protein